MEVATKKPDGTFEYGTLQEAERRLEEKKVRINTTFCPLSEKPCRRSCVCCEELKVVNIGSEDSPIWECHGGFCTAYMLVGPS